MMFQDFSLIPFGVFLDPPYQVYKGCGGEMCYQLLEMHCMNYRYVDG
uniref:Uncharacterized protein n=1 Tax=Amphimedon queenslandica TaxID=400682 RepID=A0A1X7V926_AMPQE